MKKERDASQLKYCTNTVLRKFFQPKQAILFFTLDFFFTPLPLTILHFIPETYLHNDRMNEFHSTTMEYVEKYFYIDYIKEV